MVDLKVELRHKLCVENMSAWIYWEFGMAEDKSEWMFFKRYFNQLLQIKCISFAFLKYCICLVKTKQNVV